MFGTVSMINEQTVFCSKIQYIFLFKRNIFTEIICFKFTKSCESSEPRKFYFKLLHNCYQSSVIFQHRWRACFFKPKSGKPWTSVQDPTVIIQIVAETLLLILSVCKVKAQTTPPWLKHNSSCVLLILCVITSSHRTAFFQRGSKKAFYIPTEAQTPTRVTQLSWDLKCVFYAWPQSHVCLPV